MTPVLNTNLVHNTINQQKIQNKNAALRFINDRRNVDNYLPRKSYIDPKTGEIFMFIPDENGEIVLAHFNVSCFTINK